MSHPRRLSRELAALDGTRVRVAGHLEEYRALGGVAFALVRDGAGSTQVTLKKGRTPSALFDLFRDLPRESVVEVEGEVRRSDRAHRGVELLPERVEVLARADVPLPLGVVDKVGAELPTRLDHRVLDLRKPTARALFELRAALTEGLRAALRARGFLEVDTPKLLQQGAEGGATLFAVGYFDAKAFLAQSPQLYKQMLIGAGFERVFEIAPAFRAEPSDTVRHITEFTSVDAELAYPAGPDEPRTVLEGILVDAVEAARDGSRDRENPFIEGLPRLRTPFPRVPFAEVEEWLGRPHVGRDFGTEEEKAMGELVRERLGATFYFVTDFPTAVKAHTFYAMRQDDRPELTYYSDLYAGGIELASGGLREHRLDRLTAQMHAAGVDPASFGGYLEAFRFGMPPHGGWGLGLDRLLWALTGLPNIREVRLFPRDRYRLAP